MIDPPRTAVFRLVAAGLTLLMLAGCTTTGSSPGLLELWREALHGHFRGHWPEKVERLHPVRVQVPIPRPYVLVKSGTNGTLDFQVVYLPDGSEELRIEPRSQRARFTLALNEAGFVREISGQFKVDRVQIGGAPVQEFAQPARFSDLSRAGGLQPGLYRIVTSDAQGGTTPRLEAVQLQPPAWPEALRIDAIRFQTCADKPEVVQRIEITADRGQLADLQRLAAQVQVFRGDALLDVQGLDVQGRAMTIPVDPDCARSYSAYSVALPSRDLSPGSILEAKFPTAEQLTDLRPRAAVQLIADDQKRPRFLLIELAANGGSPVLPLTALDRPANLLLINGRTPRSARITHGAGGAYWIDLGDEEIRSLFLFLVPGNAAGLQGEPIAFTWTAGESPREEPKKPASVIVQETALDPGPAGRILNLVLNDPAHRMDVETTMSRNRGPWSDVRCQPRKGAELVCTGSTTMTGNLRFDIYCLQETVPCTTVSFTD